MVTSEVKRLNPCWMQESCPSLESYWCLKTPFSAEGAGNFQVRGVLA